MFTFANVTEKERCCIENPHAGTSHAGVCKIRYGIVNGFCNLQAEYLSVWIQFYIQI